MIMSYGAVETGSGTIFTDLDDADANLVKAEPVSRIAAIVRKRGMTRIEAGRLCGLSRPGVFRLLGSDCRPHSPERLLRILTGPPATGGQLRVAASDTA